ncbi:MAG: radical SAM protein [Chloroflexi bacterium]|nr:radical SAM protein [Chloroflexota bacterium]
MSFRRPEIIRPPSEAGSYFLPLTSGCSNNTCTFCGYHGSKLQMRDPDDVRREIDALALYMTSGAYVAGVPDIVYSSAGGWDGKRLFLQDGDALVYPLRKLNEVLQHINEALPSVERISAYATPQDILRIDAGQLEQLRSLKLGILYMGLESGDDEVLRRTAKGVNAKQMVEAARRAKEAGILTSVTVILGLGGVEGSERHALETSRVLSEMDPDYAGALTLVLIPGTPLYDEWRQGTFRLISPMESLKELVTIVRHSSFTRCFFSSMHASNYFAVRGQLPRDKKKMIGQLERVIAEGDASPLRPESLRGL